MHAIVTGSDTNYFSLLDDLLRSIERNVSRGDIEICVLDLGLQPDELAVVEQRAAHVATPGWDVDVSRLPPLPAYRKAMTAIPFLYKYFPGYCTYTWIDADAWVQTQEAIDLYIEGALTGHLTVTPETDRNYPDAAARGKVRMLPDLPIIRHVRRRASTWLFRAMRSHYGIRFANSLLFKQAFNSGALSLSPKSDFWKQWQASYEQIKIRRARDICDQRPMNHAIYANHATVNKLPAYCNWICELALPMWDEERELYVEPSLPHHPISIMHLLGSSKRRSHRVHTIAGATIETDLRFSTVPRTSTSKMRAQRRDSQ